MLKKLQRSKCEGFPPELPVEAAAGEGLAAVAGPSPALCQPRAGQRNRGPVPPKSSTSAQPRISDINIPLTSPASALVQFEHPAALCPRAGRSVCDSLWPGKPSTKSQEPPLQGRVSPGRCSGRPFRPSAVATVTRVLRIPCHLRFAPERKSLPGAQEAVLRPAGAACVRTSQPHPARWKPSLHWLRRQRYPSIQPCYGPSRPRPRRPFAHRTVHCLCRRSGA